MERYFGILQNCSTEKKCLMKMRTCVLAKWQTVWTLLKSIMNIVSLLDKVIDFRTLV